MPGEPGYLKEVLILRPALYTDGECRAESAGKKSYRAKDEEISGYTISRKDVAHFIVEDGLKNWDTWRGKCVRLMY